MARYLGPTCKLARREGTDLFLKSAVKPLESKCKLEVPPGGIKGDRRTRLSDYGVQLMAKQKLKGYYGNISEKQFRKVYDEAVRRRGDTVENLIGILEGRLDAVIYRLKFVPTVFSARQFVSHGHVRVNGVRVTIPSYQVKVDDVIELREKSRNIPIVLEAIQLNERDVPEYMEVDHNKMQGKLLRVLQFAEVPYPVQMEPNLVIEFYSR